MKTLKFTRMASAIVMAASLSLSSALFAQSTKEKDNSFQTPTQLLLGHWFPQTTETEFSETPAQFFVENLPPTEPLPIRASRAQTVAAIASDTLVAGTPAWTFLGPAPIPNGQTFNRVDPVSGRTTAIAIHPNNPNIVYVGTAQGGLYRTLNGGANWTQLMDNAPSPLAGAPLAIGSVIIDPRNSTRVFVGTGEGNLSGDSFFGNGMYIITNADSFNPVVSGPYNQRSTDGADIFTGRSITDIIVSSVNNNVVFAATSSGVGGLIGTTNSVLPPRGLYRSLNALSFSPTFTRLPVGPGTNTITTAAIAEPGNPDNVYAAVYGQSAGDAGGIYRSTNTTSIDPANPTTFTLVQALPTFSNVKFAISKQGATVTVYATSGENEPGGNQGKLYKSTDGVTFVEQVAARGFAGGQGFYDAEVGVDPLNPNNVYIGGQAGNRIFQYSLDGGATFTPSPTGLHADVHAINVAPSNPNIIYHGNDGGIWRSLDKGLTWTSLNTTGFSATQFSGIALHPTDRNFTLSGSQDNGTELLKPDGSFFRVDFGDGGYTLIDQNATDTTTVTLYHTYYNQRNNLIGTARVLNVPCATEGQWTFHGIYGGAVDPTVYCDGTTDTFNGIALTDSVIFYAPMVLGPGNPNTWYFGTDKLYRSTDQATTALVASQLLDPIPGLPFGGSIASIGVAPQDDNIRLVGMAGSLSGKIFATTTGSATLLQIAGQGATNGPPTGTPNVAVNRIAIDPNNKDIAYVAYNGFGTAGAPIQHVYKISNLTALSATPPGQVVFTPMSNGLP
ncbi:MAG: WD40/YVTN/BNR-like repeat-containing protein, partial [Chthoniobacterales bacterium]